MSRMEAFQIHAVVDDRNLLRRHGVALHDVALHHLGIGDDAGVGAGSQGTRLDRQGDVILKPAAV